MAAANEHALQNTWVLWEHAPVDRVSQRIFEIT